MNTVCSLRSRQRQDKHEDEHLFLLCPRATPLLRGKKHKHQNRHSECTAKSFAARTHWAENEDHGPKEARKKKSKRKERRE